MQKRYYVTRRKNGTAEFCIKQHSDILNIPVAIGQEGWMNYICKLLNKVEETQ